MTWKTKWKIRKSRLLLTLGQLRLRHWSKRNRKLLRSLPLPEEMKDLFPVPKTMTAIKTPMRMTPETGLQYRLCLEIMIETEERLLNRMRELTMICSDSLMRK